MRHHLERHKHLIVTAGLLMFASGCAGAISKTSDQLGKEAATTTPPPIERPLNQDQQAENTK